MAKENALEAGESPPDDREKALVRAALELAGQVTEDVEGLVGTILKQRRRLETAGGTHMDERWAREMETRMVKVETEIKMLAPVGMVREMIEPLQQDVRELAFNVKEVSSSVKELAHSDLELKEMHKALMVERAQQEEAKHRLEIETLQEKLAEQRAASSEAEKARRDAEQKRGAIVFVTQKAQPVLGFLIALAVLVGVVYGFILWINQHVK